MYCEACGHEKGHKYNEYHEYKEINPDGEAFIEIKGNFTVDIDYRLEEVSLYACPICKTVTMVKV